MSQPLSFQTSFVLDKSHFSECYDQSVTELGPKAYSRALVLALVGITLVFFVDVSQYLAFFVVALSAVEALSVYYKKTWWLWRQMISKAYNHTVDLTIDSQHIITKSFHVNDQIAWQDVTEISETSVGFLIRHAGGVNYLSKSYLSDEAIDFIKTKSA